VPRLMRRVWPASLWHRLSWGLAFTPFVFVVLVSADVATTLAVVMAFAPELFATVAVLVLLFLLGRRIARAVRRNHAEDR
jgi:NhaP-type Na+/H+ or K+/H+ antiporter